MNLKTSFWRVNKQLLCEGKEKLEFKAFIAYRNLYEKSNKH